ncbi:HET-domain-containing protein [Melanomma pulvis-pyrius CBS 109.77]|uniref:HET-domain-containing protein n=1 Tax=Melanomma pulvis-pyrius CBS 109.77 TaxID=1314802 RepID=A0A6A6XN11_9PLEO|nr:HET-domain-containing protein [Melanomma pulvis-pyrius CBS 109.77]
MTHTATTEKHTPSTPSKPRTICSYLKPCLPAKSQPLYTPLPHPNSIRLLRIHHGKPSQLIKCTLKLARLDDSLPSYEALSYVWGLKEGQKEISLNGFSQKVNTNLFDALERLRGKRGLGLGGGKKLVWVDALCIDQGDQREKGHQVGLMSSIYTRAAGVLVWLGTDGHNEAYKAFSILRAVVGANTQAHTQDKKPQILQSNVGVDAPPPRGSKAWLPVMSLFVNTWFLRMWVLQEIVLARCATFLWGDASLSWDVLGAAIDVIRADPHLHATLESRQLQNAFFMHHLYGVRAGGLDRGVGFPFLHLLDLARSFDVTEPKDKVYGLLGFPTKIGQGVPSRRALFVEPCYESSLGEIYTDVARRLVAQGGNLDVLSFATHTGAGAGSDGDMPSWVPDWSSKTIVYPFAGLGPKSRHKAGTAREMQVLPTENQGVLSVRGVVLDTVEEALAPVPYKNIYEVADEIKRVVRWYLERKGGDSKTRQEGDGATAAMLANVLTASRQASGALVADPNQHLADFCAYIEDIDKDLLYSAWPVEADTLAALAAAEGNAGNAREAVFKVTCYRSALFTQQGRLGLGPGATRAGDLIVVFWGAQVPFVVRKEGEGEGRYRFVGECFVDGLMDGGTVRSMVEDDGDGETIFELS